ncbi:hypothetical protein C8R45DRAFT_931771 [Mycena sanguinolenta]|nr:hypothetical protein C8R45DRAFT_931771 [Mycena sanguinolenta]
MSKSSTPPMESSAFTRRRRAHIACGNCRRRKIKCVMQSEVDYSPCTRCAQKGLKCEYWPGPSSDEPLLDSITPPPSNPPSSHYLDESYSPPPIRPPSAGIREYLDSSTSAHRGTGPPFKSSEQQYRFHSTPLPAAVPSATLNRRSSQHPTPQYFPVNSHPAAMQQHPSGAVAPQYYPNATPYMGNPNMQRGSIANYSQQQYTQYAPQASRMVSAQL